MLIEEEIAASSTRAVLHSLSFPVHRNGYNHLLLAITRYAQGDMPSLTKELYPYVAKAFGYVDWYPIEHSIRTVILDAWKNGDPQTWAVYFPHRDKAPSNKLLIATLAEQLQENTPPVSGRG